MATFIGILLLGLAVILQTTIVGQMPLLYGPADLVLLMLLSWTLHARARGMWQWGLIAGLMVGYASALPIWVPLAGYLAAIGVAYVLQSRVWQAPIMSLVTTTLLGTFIVQGVALAFLILSGVPLDIGQSFNLVMLPSVILNLILALPVYGVMGELTKRLYPAEKLRQPEALA